MPKLIKLSNGQEVTINLDNITHDEFIALLDPKQKKADELTILSKVSGLTVEELRGNSHGDFKRVAKGLMDANREEMNDPNSVSESISES